ncbi:MAG: NUDIX domain-containing protein [Clostridia bacterium]|nr:NUDIX domain-containing protein [Clostridia bacterium]MDE6211303.1 NUDIX domain-containing protein [Clostridia bacterium]MDE6604577.1 NUDIX domain-containing protein [Clostridia bacterium]
MQAKFYYQDKNAPKPNKPNHIGVTAILINDGRILFEKRSDCARWSLIGGGLKVNETLKECFSREIVEETGLELQAPSSFAIYDDPSRIVAYPDGNVLRIITAVFVKDINIDEVELRASNESFELRFFDFDDIKSLDIVETHRHIVNDFLDGKLQI